LPPYVPESPYRGASASATVDAYLVAWEDLRKRRTRRWIAFLALVPVGGGLGLSTDTALRSLLPFEPALIVMIPIMACLAALIVHVAFFRCPRCGREFHRSGLVSAWWTRRCLNCGLAIGTSKAQDEEAERLHREADVAHVKAGHPPRRPHLE
jgi:hypothetical protein